MLNAILWSTAIVFLIGGGLYFTLKLKFNQLRFLSMFKSLKHSDNEKISPFSALTMSLAARIGVGSLSGIALAIYMGGPGTIFWIWISSIITSANAFSESVLGVLYREKDGDVHKGGPAYYIDKGLNNKMLAKTYAVLIIIAYIFGFMTIQANTITTSVSNYIHIKPIIIGIILASITAYSIIRGVKGIVSVTNKLVPIMGIVYVLLSVYIIIVNFHQLGSILNLIIKSAFDIKSFGTGILSTFIIGVQRGVFSTEAGLGSGAIASSTTDSDDAVKIGLTQVLGIYFTSFIICTSTAIIILTSNYLSLNLSNINGIEITQYALQYHLNDLGVIILIFSIISFAFSTIIAGYYYGESNLKFLDKNIKKTHILFLKLLTIILLILGSIVDSSIIWTIVDILVAIMAIINMYAIYNLREVVKNALHFHKKS